MNKIITQFIPIIVLFLLLSYSKEFIEFSGTILGKLFAVIVVLYKLCNQIIKTEASAA